MTAGEIVPSGQEAGGAAEPAAAAHTGDGRGDARGQFAQVPPGLTLSGCRPGCSARCPACPRISHGRLLWPGRACPAERPLPGTLQREPRSRRQRLGSERTRVPVMNQTAHALAPMAGGCGKRDDSPCLSPALGSLVTLQAVSGKKWT